MADTKDSGSLHVVVFPWLAFGHILPFFELSKHLARRGHRISFVSAPRNLKRLPNLPPELAPLFHLVPIALPNTAGLPDGAEATSDLPPDDVPSLKKALDGMERPFADFIRDAAPRPDWIIQDFAQHWIPAIAAEAGVPTVYFSNITAANLVFHGTAEVVERHGFRRTTPEQYTAPPPWIPFPSKLAFRPHEVRAFFQGFADTKHGTGVSDGERGGAAYNACKGLAIRSSVESEPMYLPLLQQIYGKPIIPVGVLQPPTPADDAADAGIIEWLDGQKPKSVVYIAFGSEVMLSGELMMELARGIELAGLPFLWAVRRPAGTPDGVEVLPEGFEGRTEGYGMVCKGWVPQLRILAHEAVGGFLTHSGWSSAIESLRFGHPLVLLPVSNDQWLNAREMEEIGYGIEVERNEEDGSFTRESIAMALKLVMVEDGGESCRRKAEELRGVFADEGCQDKYVDGFVQFLQENRTAVEELE